MNTEKLFKKILVPISSEFYSKKVIKRGLELAETLHSSVTIAYIMEKKTLYKTEKLLETYLPFLDKTETQKEIIKKERETADLIVFEEANRLLKNYSIHFDKKVLYGEFSDVILSEVEHHNYDLVVIGYQKACLLNYRLIDTLKIPVWIETEDTYRDIILGICSNLAPNKKVPNISIALSQILGWKLQILYIVDTEDTVEVDEKGSRYSKDRRALILSGRRFIDKIREKGIPAELVQGSFENEVIKKANEINPGLIIIGRERKQRGKLGLPIRNARRKIVEKSKHSVLLLN